MRQQGNNQRRPRGRANRKPPLSPRSQTFESNGPDVRVRGNAHQVHEKYLNLARDAAAAGDRIAAESYFQFAEHYFRLLNDSTDPQRQGHRDRAPQHHRDGRPQGPPSEQPVVDMGYQQETEGAPVQDRPRGPRANGHDSPSAPIAGDAAGAAKGPGRSAETVEAGEEKVARAEQPAVASVSAAPPSEGSEQSVPDQPAAEQPGSEARDPEASESDAEKRPPVKRRVGRPRRKAANGADDKAADGADAKAEQKDEEPSQDQSDNDTVTP